MTSKTTCFFSHNYDFAFLVILGVLAGFGSCEQSFFLAGKAQTLLYPEDMVKKFLTNLQLPETS